MHYKYLAIAIVLVSSNEKPREESGQSVVTYRLFELRYFEVRCEGLHPEGAVVGAVLYCLR